jgi:hypothetical protein
MEEDNSIEIVNEFERFINSNNLLHEVYVRLDNGFKRVNLTKDEAIRSIKILRRMPISVRNKSKNYIIMRLIQKLEELEDE